MILVLCPISLEFKYVLQYMQSLGVDLKPVHEKGEKKLYRSQKFFLGQGGHGKVDYALALQKLLLKYEEIQSVLCLGCAGSLVSHIKPLSVVLGEQTIEHDHLEKFSPGPLPCFHASPSLLGLFTGREVEGLEVFQGPIASGDEDIISAERALEIREKTQALAVAWEGAGGARACRSLGKDFLEIRAITDSCSSQSSEDFSTHLKKAMENAVDLLLRVL